MVVSGKRIMPASAAPTLTSGHMSELAPRRVPPIRPSPHPS
jgi:hypothetical protein